MKCLFCFLFLLAVVKIPVLRTKVATVPTVTTSLKGRLVGHARRVLAGLVVVEQHLPLWGIYNYLISYHTTPTSITLQQVVATEPNIWITLWILFCNNSAKVLS